MERLTAADSWFLYLETPTVHCHAVGVMVLDPSGVAGGLGPDRVRDHIAGRLPLLTDFRRRVVEVPLGIDHPVWVRDPAFRIEDHVHHHVLDEASDRAFHRFLGDYASHQLDRTRPLWDMVWVEGLPGGRAALAAKLHHTIVDGVTGMAILADLFDLGPDADRVVEDTWEPEPVPDAAHATVDAVAARLADPLRPVRSLARLAGSAARIASTAVSSRLVGGQDAAGPFDAPRLPFNSSLTVRRAVSTGRTSFAAVREVRRALGVTVNDVVLAACALGLRRHLEREGRLPDRALTCSVPVSVHGQAGGGATNQVSEMFVHLPVAEADPLEVVRTVHRSADSAKAVQAAMGPEVIGDVVDLVPPPVFHLAVDLWSRTGLPERLPPVHNLIVSNVPGSPVPLWFAGAPLVGLYPFGPLMEGAGLNVTVVSYGDHLDLGLISCPDLVPDLDAVRDDVLEGFAELHRLVGDRGRRRTARTG